jgi:transcriptional regulator with XRE-family HTH domain
LDKHKYSSAERLNSGFATRLRSLLDGPEDTKKLAAYLGCSPQAVSLFRSGTSFPKTENLIRIAEYFDCSIDYLVGLSDTKKVNESNKAVRQYTGLSEKAVDCLHSLNKEDREIVNRIIENELFPLIIKTHIRFAVNAIKNAIKHKIPLTGGKTITKVNGVSRMVLSPVDESEYYLSQASKGLASILSDIVKEHQKEG